MGQLKKQRIAVVTDSTAYIPQELLQRHAIHVVPLHLMMGGKTWLDGVEIDPPAFYKLLRKSPDFPSTSQPNVATFETLFRKLSEEAEGIVAVLISNDLSGTVDSALGAKVNLPDIPIEIVDSRGTAMMLGFAALEAARTADDGAGLQEVADRARAIAEKAHVFFVVDTLEYLHRGGRIGGAAKFLGSALNLKPILELRDGVVKPLTKVRTRRKAIEKLFSLLEEQVAGGGPAHMAVINVDAIDEATQIRDELRTRFQPVELVESEVSPVIGAHVGPGTVGVVFYVE